MSAVATDGFYSNYLIRLTRNIAVDPDEVVCVKRHVRKEAVTYPDRPGCIDTVERVFSVTFYLRSFPLDIEVSDLLPGVLDRWFPDDQELKF